MEIKYTKIEKKHYKELCDIIRYDWFDDYPFPERTKKLYARAYLYEYLRETNYGLVALANGKVVGLLFTKINKPKFSTCLINNIKLFGIILAMLFCKKGFRGLKIGYITNKTNRRLLKPFKKELHSELLLFMVHHDYRKMGIGTKMIGFYKQELAMNHLNAFYLFTDTYSNYQYYDNSGYIRLNEQIVNFGIKNEDKVLPTYFLYKKEI